MFLFGQWYLVEKGSLTNEVLCQVQKMTIFVRKCTRVCLFASIFLNFHFLPVQVYPNETASAEFPLWVDHADLLFHWFSEGPYGASHPSTRSEPNSSINIKMCIILLFGGEKNGCAFSEFGYYEHPTLTSKFFLGKEHFWLTSMFGYKFGYNEYRLGVHLYELYCSL